MILFDEICDTHNILKTLSNTIANCGIQPLFNPMLSTTTRQRQISNLAFNSRFTDEVDAIFLIEKRCCFKPETTLLCNILCLFVSLQSSVYSKTLLWFQLVFQETVHYRRNLLQLSRKYSGWQQRQIFCVWPLLHFWLKDFQQLV